MPRLTQRIRGFSLVELIAVLVVLSLAISLAIPALHGGLDKSRLKAGARHLASTLRFARNFAATRKCVVVVNVDLEQRTYWLASYGDEQESTAPPSPGRWGEAEQEPTLPPADGEGEEADRSPRIPASLGLQARQELPQGASLFFVNDDEEVDEGIATIEFFPRGNSTGGVLKLISGRSGYTITVQRVTGRVILVKEV